MPISQQVPQVKNCDPSVKKAIQRLSAVVFGRNATPAFGGLTLGTMTGIVKATSGVLSAGSLAAGDLPAHQLDGAVHTVSGLTPGHYLKAISATTFGFAALPAAAAETDPVVGAITGIIKANGAGVISAAGAGTDYEVPLTFGDGLIRTVNDVAIDFNSTNLKITAAQIDTIQGINPTTGTPQFLRLGVGMAADGTVALSTTGTSYFSGNMGIGVAPNVSYGLYCSPTINSALARAGRFILTSNSINPIGLVGNVISTRDNFAGTIVTGLNFVPQWLPTSIGANRTATAMVGGVSGAQATNPDASKTMTVSLIKGWTTGTAANSEGFVFDASAGGAVTVTELRHFDAFPPKLTGAGATISLQSAFYCPALTEGTVNWGCAINTQSYFNANVAIGKNTAPAYPLDAVGDISSSTLFRIGATAGLTSQVVALAKITPVTGTDGSITITGGIVTAYTAPT